MGLAELLQSIGGGGVVENEMEDLGAEEVGEAMHGCHGHRAIGNIAVRKIAVLFDDTIGCHGLLLTSRRSSLMSLGEPQALH